MTLIALEENICFPPISWTRYGRTGHGGRKALAAKVGGRR